MDDIDNQNRIQPNYAIEARYDLSLADLEKLNFTVPYPPDISMKGMKIYYPK